MHDGFSLLLHTRGGVVRTPGFEIQKRSKTPTPATTKPPQESMAYTTVTPRKETQPSKRVGKTEQLEGILGFEGCSRKHFTEFEETTILFRRIYRTQDGSLGESLLVWSKPCVQTELQDMATKYLSEHGTRFWPKENEHCTLSFPQDEPR